MIEKNDLTTTHLAELRDVLGKKNIKTEVESPFDFIRIATNGLDANIIKNFKAYFNLSLDTTAHMLNVSEPSIYRWIKSNKKLDRNLSIKIFEISELFLLGTELFRSKENFFKWLKHLHKNFTIYPLYLLQQEL